MNTPPSKTDSPEYEDSTIFLGIDSDENNETTSDDISSNNTNTTTSPPFIAQEGKNRKPFSDVSDVSDADDDDEIASDDTTQDNTNTTTPLPFISSDASENDEIQSSDYTSKNASPFCSPQAAGVERRSQSLPQSCNKPNLEGLHDAMFQLAEALGLRTQYAVSMTTDDWNEYIRDQNQTNSDLPTRQGNSFIMRNSFGGELSSSHGHNDEEPWQTLNRVAAVLAAKNSKVCLEAVNACRFAVSSEALTKSIPSRRLDLSRFFQRNTSHTECLQDAWNAMNKALLTAGEKALSFKDLGQYLKSKNARQNVYILDNMLKIL